MSKEIGVRPALQCPLMMPPSYMKGAPVTPSALILILLSAHGLQKATEDGPSTWDTVTHVADAQQLMAPCYRTPSHRCCGHVGSQPADTNLLSPCLSNE